MDKKRITIVEFVNGKKVTFDESKFELEEDLDTITVIRKEDNNKIFCADKSNVLYWRTGIIKIGKNYKKGSDEK